MATNTSNKSRQGHLGYLTRLFNEIESLISDYGNIVRVKEIHAKLNAAWKRFEQITNDYITGLGDENPSDQQRAIEQLIDQQAKIDVYGSKVELYLKDANAQFSRPITSDSAQFTQDNRITANNTWPTTVGKDPIANMASYSAPSSISVGSRRSIKSTSSKRSDVSERLRKAEHEFEKSRIMQDHAEQRIQRSLLIESKRLELELQRRMEIARLEAERSVEDAKNRTRIAMMDVEMAKKEFSDVERQEYDDEFPREVTPIPYGGKSTSTSLQAEPSTPTLKPEIDQLHHFTTTPCTTSPLRKNCSTGPELISTCVIPDQPTTPLEHNKDILNAMVKTMERISLSQEIPLIKVRKFSGNPEEFPSFRQRFNQLVECKPLDESLKMASLLQHLEGAPLKMALPYETISGGLRKALDLLQRRFGQPCQIVRACIDKLKGPQINYNDRKGLQAFADDVESTYETLKSMNCLQEINTDHLERIVLRLPRNMQTSFGEYLRKLEEKGQTMPNFGNVVHFLKNKTCAVNHPFFSSASSENAIAKNVTPRPMFKATTMSTSEPSINTTTQGLKETSANSTLKSSSATCILCSKSHPLYCCESFKSKSVKDRREFVVKQGLCLNCISSRRHMCRACPSSSRCKVCGKSHHSLLHDSSKQQAANTQLSSTVSLPLNTVQPGATTSQTNNLSSQGNVSALLQVIPIVVFGENNKTVTTYALIDSGSDTTLIDESLALQLGMKADPQTFFITTVTDKNVKGHASKVNFKVSSIDSLSTVQVNVSTAWAVKDLDIPLRHSKKGIHELPHLQSIPFPDVERSKISVLLGTDVPEAFVPIDVIKGLPSQPFAIQTVLGWSVLGRTSDEKSTLNVNCTCSKDNAVEESLKRFWEIESSGIERSASKTLSVEDTNAIKIIEDTISKADGHYQMGLLWRDENVQLPNNRVLADARLSSLKGRLKKNPQLHTKYKDVIDDYVDKGYARKLTEEEVSKTTNITWYLPHHPVFNANKPGKVRVVFDAAAKFQGTSLNDQLVQGPDRTNNLIGVLLRFREERIALTSDIEAMFHQTRVIAKDTDALRFLWWSDGVDSLPSVYKMLVHIFGAKSSPCCANSTLKQIADDNEGVYDSTAIDTVRRNFYVDDELKSVPTEEEAIRLADQLIALTREGGYNLTKFMSNSRKVLASIPKERRAKPDVNLDFDELPNERALGLKWNAENDYFYFNSVNTDKPQTKRGVLSIVSSLYDPLGFLSPFVLLAKIIIQELWRTKYDWDETIQEPYVSQWNNWLDMLERLKNISIPRCYKHPLTTSVTSTQLHFFSDASKQGLAACCYIRIVDSNGLIHVTLVIGKSRNTPLKDWSIPRLELQAAVMSARLYGMVRAELDVPIDETYLWVDSMTVLQYIMNTTRRFRPFVAFRISEIHELSLPSQWRYVPGVYNPADYGSRGMKIDEFNSNCCWLSGPSFLRHSDDFWPSSAVGEVPTDDKEITQPKVQSVCYISSGSPLDRLLNRFSSWSRLQTSVAWVLRFIMVIQKQNPPRGPLHIKEIRYATKVIARLLQRQFFQDELTSLQSGRQVKGQSKLANLNPVLVDGLICVGGRTSSAPLTFQKKHPIILPKHHVVTTSIVRFYHETNAHAGREHVVSLLRRVFWIIQARSLVRSVLRRCIVCRRHNESTMKQIMADLPKERLTPYEPPFTFTGVDVFGPFTVKRGRTTQKIYGCLFVCFNSRAIHIEDLSSLETDSFINGLRRFFSNRGFPKQIWSDNGTNFVGAERELKQAIKELNHDKLVVELRRMDVEWYSCPFVEWRFQPPGASHMSGVWERLVRSVKKAMKGVLGNPKALVNQETLRTVFADVVTILNGRPLCPVSDDPKDLEPLTPNHLLLQGQMLATPPGVFNKEDIYSRKKWKCAQFLANCFWSRWLREYVPLLQVRQKWLSIRRNLQIDDLVLVVDQNLPRGRWLLGRVQEVFPGRDGKVRSAQVKTKSSSLTRPITKLCLLEESST